ncbi:hypothetical protein DOY81_000734 [Sarcophaga bullata]|nr:hypothetical protein DOY81_000734 [Sarcophaga bullata]
MHVLFNNYEEDTLVNEHVTPMERKEENDFVDAVMATNVMRQAMLFLQNKGIVTTDPKTHRDLVKELWFTQYSRGNGKIGSSGFEHVFVNEVKNGTIIGLHNWLYFADEEKAGRLDYKGYLNQLDLGTKAKVLKVRFTHNGLNKPVNTLFVGTSPELELALYTVCFKLRPDRTCPVSLGNSKFGVVTYSWRYRDSKSTKIKNYYINNSHKKSNINLQNKKSLGILASIPAGLLILSLFGLLLYLLTRCCDRLYGNDDFHNGLLQAFSSGKQTEAIKHDLETKMSQHRLETEIEKLGELYESIRWPATLGFLTLLLLLCTVLRSPYVYFLNCGTLRNRFILRLNESRDLVERARDSVHLIRRMSQETYPRIDVHKIVETMDNDLEETKRNLSVLSATLDRRAIDRHYSDALRGLCGGGLLGLSLMMVAGLLTSLLFTILVYADSHAWIYLSKRRLSVDADKSETAPLFPSNAPSANISPTAPVHHTGTINRTLLHHQQAHGISSGHHTLGRLPSHQQPSYMAGPNNGKYATLSKQCKTLEANDFY